MEKAQNPDVLGNFPTQRPEACIELQPEVAWLHLPTPLHTESQSHVFDFALTVNGVYLQKAGPSLVFLWNTVAKKPDFFFFFFLLRNSEHLYNH